MNRKLVILDRREGDEIQDPSDALTMVLPDPISEESEDQSDSGSESEPDFEWTFSPLPPKN